MANLRYAVIPVAVDAFLVEIASMALVLRFLSGYFSKAGVWWDDWLALVAWPFSVTICISSLVAGFHGFGDHGGDPTFFLHVLYFDEIWYNTGIALTKLSVLCFYYRIFACGRRFTQILCVTGVLVVVWWITFEMASIFQCVPVQAYWNPKIKAHCVEKFAFFMGQAVPNIVLDFVLLTLPLKALWKLQMRPVQKSALLVVFLLGYLNPIISILRIVSFIQLGRKAGEDINFNFVSPALWSAAEVAIAIFSCSVPSLTHLFRRAVNSSRRSTEEKPSDDEYFARSNSPPELYHDLESFGDTSENMRGKGRERVSSTRSITVSGGFEDSANDGECPQSTGQIKVRREFDVNVHQAP